MAADPKNLLRSGLAWQTGQFSQYGSDDVTYRRGAQSVVVRAMSGKKLLKLDDGMGSVRVEMTDRDFFIPAADIDFGDGPTTPLRGDLIDVEEAYDTQTYEVLPLGANEPAWRWTDPMGQTMLVAHTKRISVTGAYP